MGVGRSMEGREGEKCRQAGRWAVVRAGMIEGMGRLVRRAGRQAQRHEQKVGRLFVYPASVC